MYRLSLDAQHRTITLEARTGSDASLQQALTRLPEFLKATQKKLVDALSHPIDALFPEKNLAWAVNQMTQVPYPQMRAIEVPVVPGLKTDYLSYTTRLADDAKLCKQLEQEFFDPFIDFLARKLNSPDGLRSAKPDASLDHIKMDQLNVHNAAMGKIIGGKDSATRPYGQVIRRHADWHEINTHSQFVHTAFTQVDHDRFKAKVERADALLATLIQRLSHDPELYKVSGRVLALIVDKAYVLATAAEFYGMTYRRALTLDYQLDQLIEATKKRA